MTSAAVTSAGDARAAPLIDRRLRGYAAGHRTSATGQKTEPIFTGLLHFPGTRRFSSSNQFVLTTMVGADAARCGVCSFFKTRNRRPSDATS